MLYWYAAQYQHPQTSKYPNNNKINFTLNLVQNWTKLLNLAYKNNCSNSKFDMINQHLKDVQGPKVNNVIITKIWKVARIANIIFLGKSKRPISFFQIEVFSLLFFCVYSVFIIFHSQYLMTHINKGTILIRRQRLFKS